MAKKTKKWVQKSIQRPGRTRAYLRKLYGSAAFNKDGTIKQTYLDKAIARVKNSNMPTKQKRSLLSALNLAKRFKKGL